MWGIWRRRCGGAKNNFFDMKTAMIFLALCVPVWAWGQRPVNAGGYVGIYDCNLAGKYTGEKSRTAWGAGAWVEWNAREWWGLKFDVSYQPKGGEIEGVRLKAEYLTFSVVPRLHLSDASSRARLVVGVGVFTHMLSLGDRDAFLKVPDVGGCAELGIEWRRVSLLAKGQVGFLDAVDVIEKSQRWGVFGVGVEVPIRGRDVEGATPE